MPQTLDIQPEKKKKFSFKMFDKHVRDISFSNLFWKKFVIRLVVLLIASCLLLMGAMPLIVEWNERVVDSEMTSAALELSELLSSDMPKDRIITTTNVMLSRIQDSFDDNPFITESSITAYDLTNSAVIAKSFLIATIESDDIMLQWRKMSGIENGEPIILLTQDMEDFCISHINENIKVKKLCLANSVLVPVEVVIVDDEGKEIESYATLYASTTRVLESYQPVMLRVIGNVKEDIIYNDMSSFKIEQSENGAVVTYSDIDTEKVSVKSTEMSIGNCNYRIDCGYQINFWAGALLYVLLIELIAVMICALSAFINTKETLSILR